MVFRVVFFLVILTALLKNGEQYHQSNVISHGSLFTSGGPHVSPHTVAIIRDNDWHKRGVGTLITKEHVLSAAQSVDCEKAVVILGAYDILGKEKTQIRKDISRNDIIIHRYYDPRTHDNDIALIKLPHPVELTPFVNIAHLPDGDLHVPYGTKAYLTGWESRLTGYSNILAQAEVTILSRDKCASLWPTGRITDRKICASNTRREGQVSHLLGADCITDPGSPLTLHGHTDTIIGFVTAAGRCGSLLPEIFTNVAHYRIWIDEVIGHQKVVPVELLDGESSNTALEVAT